MINPDQFFQVIRTHLSTYQHKDFILYEQECLDKIPNVTYRSFQDAKNEPTILITNTHTRLTELPRELLNQTKLIVHPNSGYDNFTHDLDLLNHIPVIVGHSIRAQAVAEYSIRALFEGLSELPKHLRWCKERNWERTLLKGQSLWIFGYGHVGKIIAHTMSSLGMVVTIVDPFINECPFPLLKKWQEGELKKARVIIVASSLNKTSHHLLDKHFFSSLSDQVLIINGARGKIIEEKSLRNFLLAHPSSYAFLDVFEQEPFQDDWHGFPQVWKSSHIAGVEKDLDNKILDFEVKVIHDYLTLKKEEFMHKYEQELLQNKWRKGVLI